MPPSSATSRTHDGDASFEPVFLLCGQSNMAGRCSKEDLPSSSLLLEREADVIMCWDNDCNFGSGGDSNLEWRPLQCQPSPGLGGMNCFGPEFGIAETLPPRITLMDGGGASDSKRCCHFLKFAMGSTNLHSNWNPNNKQCVQGKPAEIGYYPKFIDFCRQALETSANSNDDHPSKKIVGMFWLQGESDSSKAKDANAYFSNLERFIAAVRNDLNVPDLFVVVSPIVWNGKKVAVVNQALQKAATSISNCICIDELAPPLKAVQTLATAANPACVDHLSPAAVLDIGRRMGLAFPVEHIV